MKITDNDLRQIINEELEQMIDEGFFDQLRAKASGLQPGKAIGSRAKAAFGKAGTYTTSPFSSRMKQGAKILRINAKAYNKKIEKFIRDMNAITKEIEQDLGEGGEGMFDGKGLNVMDLEFGNVPGVRKDIDSLQTFVDTSRKVLQATSRTLRTYNLLNNIADHMEQLEDPTGGADDDILPPAADPEDLEAVAKQSRFVMSDPKTGEELPSPRSRTNLRGGNQFPEE